MKGDTKALAKTVLRYFGVLFMIGAYALTKPEYRVLMGIIGFVLFLAKDLYVHE